MASIGFFAARFHWRIHRQTDSPPGRQRSRASAAAGEEKAVWDIRSYGRLGLASHSNRKVRAVVSLGAMITVDVAAFQDARLLQKVEVGFARDHQRATKGCSILPMALHNTPAERVRFAKPP
jgi:hypothetical protein